MRDHHPVIPRLTVEQLSGPAELAEIAGEWELLDRETLPRTPFTSPAYMILWWKHFSRHRRMLFHDEFFCHVVRGEGGRLVGVAPLMRTYAPGVGLPVVRMLQFFGVDAALTEIRGVICKPEDQAPVVQALVRHFLGCSDEWDVFRWTGLRQPADAFGALCAPGAFMARGDLPDYVIELPERWENLDERLSSNMRKNLRKTYKALERDGVAFSVRVTERGQDVRAAMARFLALHAARAQAEDMIFHPNKFVQPHARAFFIGTICSGLAAGTRRTQDF